MHKQTRQTWRHFIGVIMHKETRQTWRHFIGVIMHKQTRQTWRHFIGVVVAIFFVILSSSENVQGVRPLGACSQPKIIGRCRAAFPRFYFDTGRKRCRPFLYGGCGGNDNNFETESACRRRCFLLRRRDVCALRPETGPCRAMLTKYYYDRRTGQCKTFTYGGCRGNKNRFNTLDECTSTCN